MKSFATLKDRWKSLLLWAGMGMLATLLVVFSVLQFQWLGEVSLAETQRIRSALNATSTRAVRSLNEVLATLVGLTRSLDEQDSRIRDVAFASSLVSWKRNNPDAALVTNWYLAVRTGQPDSSVLVWSDSASAFVIANLDGLGIQDSTFFQSVLARVPCPPLSDVLYLSLPIRSGTGLILQTAPSSGMSGGLSVDGSDGRDSFGETSTSLIMKLDIQYFKETLVPRIFNQNLSESNLSHDFQLSLVDLSKGKASGDLVTSLFNRQIYLRYLSLGKPGNSFVDLLRMRNENGDQGQGRVSLLPDNFPAVNTFDPVAGFGFSSSWGVSFTHISGSLEHMIAQNRWRNVALSVGILLILAVAIVALFISSRRSATLARQERVFVASVSHELRTPLAVLHSAGQNLRDGIISQPESISKYGGLIMKESARLKEEVEHLLVTARLLATNAQHASESVDLGEISLSAVELVRQQFGEDVVENKIDAANAWAVNGDRDALVRVVRNLLENAVRHGKSDRPAEISIENRQKYGRRDYYLLRVRDWGQGIPRSERRNIFDPFVRGSRAFSTQVPGSGIGLTIAKRVIQAHGGRIWVEAPQGGGTTFCISMPAETSKKSGKGDRAV